MTDIEDDGGPEPYALEIICRNMGTNLYAQMISSTEETPAQFYISARNEASRAYKHPREAMISIDDFATDSYVFYTKHKEESLKEAHPHIYCDTFGYMMAIANGMPIKKGRPMIDDWW